ncbi:DUF2380 domain-containing protein [Amaricoccus sp.]|uniref:DUF2380 domain-containing protein n=1 Tax=Amaricoccus sp. TaxID=1872485 RepID=UPI001B5B0366|nr:DUF2380 domain-containing protein [Amaricoccus sp.]MBP7001663.1 DUF2380 domain-containing protein [Amaricoccus sp.]
MPLPRLAARPALLAGLLCAAAPAQAATLAVLPVKLLDTSDEAADQRAAHERRQALVAEALVRDMVGRAYDRAVAVPPAALAAACPRETTDCLLAAARDAGGDAVLLIVVHKSSTLILQAFASLVDARTGALVVSRNLSFRGDTDESWLRMADFLADTLGR